MTTTFRRLAIKRLLIAVLMLVPLVAGALFLQPSAASSSAGALATQPTVSTSLLPGGRVETVADFNDCLGDAAYLAGGWAARGVQLVANEAKIAAVLTAASNLIPGVRCGTWLGHKNIQLICWMSRYHWWIPSTFTEGTAQAFVRALTGGQISTC